MFVNSSSICSSNTKKAAKFIFWLDTISGSKSNCPEIGNDKGIHFHQDQPLDIIQMQAYIFVYFYFAIIVITERKLKVQTKPKLRTKNFFGRAPLRDGPPISRVESKLKLRKKADLAFNCTNDKMQKFF